MSGYGLIRLSANHAYNMLNEVLGEIMDVRLTPDETKREYIDRKLEETEKKLNHAMQWIYGIKDL